MRWGRWVVGLVAVCALASGCGGGKSGSDASRTTLPGAPGDTVAPGETVPPVSDTTAPGAPSDTSGGSDGQGGGTDPGGTPVEPVAPEPDAIPPATPGTYTYDNVGHTKITGCTIVNEDAPPPSTVVVDAPAGARQQSVRNDGDQGGVTTTVLEYRSDGVYLVSLKQATQAFTVEFRPPEPLLAAPRAPTVGQQLHFVLVSTDGKMQADTTITMQALDEVVTLGDGSATSAVRALTAVHLTGSSTFGQVDVNVNSVGWVSEALRMSVKSVSDTNGSVGLCNVTSHLESLLRAPTPG